MTNPKPAAASKIDIFSTKNSSLYNKVLFNKVK